MTTPTKPSTPEIGPQRAAPRTIAAIKAEIAQLQKELHNAELANYLAGGLTSQQIEQKIEDFYREE